ncbi:MAG: ABC transporter substrate-binding protein [Actinomycetota bacterium]|nr:ABC transporter substrate-binding protein [Actinomycetota bacterium]
MKLRRLWVILAILAMVATACSSGDVEDGGTDDPADEGGGSIEVAAVFVGEEKKSFEAVLDAFAEETGHEATFTSAGDDMAAFLGGKIEGGAPPDVALIAQPGLVRQLAADGSLQAASDEVAAAMEENFTPVWSDLGSVDGTLYGVYYKVSNKSTWWYNIPAFQAAGVEPPSDWDEMLETAGTVNASGVPWVSMGGADGWTLTDWFENIYVRTAGPESYDQLANHEISWTDQSVIDALNTFAELVGDEANLAGGTAGAIQTDFETSVNQVFTDKPAAATVYEGDFVPGVITAEAGAVAGEDFDFFHFPSIDGSEPAVIGGGDAAVALTDNEAAQDFLAYLATPEAAEVWASLGGMTSANQNLDTSIYPDDITRRSGEAIATAETVRFDLSDLQPPEFGGTVGRGLWLRFQDFLKDPSDAEGIAAALEKDAKKAFGE